MHGLRRTLEKIDALWFQLERVLLVVSLIMMTLLVFSDVIVRSFTRPTGKTAGLLIWIAGGDDVAEPTRQAIADTWGPGLFWLGLFLFSVFATRASMNIAAEREEREPPPLAKSVGIGVGFFIAMLVGVKVLIAVFPTGIAGAQRFALGFMVWAGFLGGSMATRSKRHILLDAVKKKLDDAAYPWFSFAGNLVTAAFTGAMAFLAWDKTWLEISEWHENPMIGVFESLPIPVWVVTIAFPITLATVALRFFALGVSDLVWGKTLIIEPDELAEEIKKIEEQQRLEEEGEPEEARLPSQLYGADHQGHLGRPVEREL
jgi:TRAP-type C4-dicarboxylate transport system permease small subunit